MEHEDLILGAVGGVVLLIVGIFIFTGGGNAEHPDLARCLAKQNATMYGFDACPHCRQQKAEIGVNAFKNYLDARGYYVRCRPRDVASSPLGERAERISSLTPVNRSTTQLQACQGNVQRGTPTWIINGRRLGGTQDVQSLAEASGCSLSDG